MATTARYQETVYDWPGRPGRTKYYRYQNGFNSTLTDVQKPTAYDMSVYDGRIFQRIIPGFWDQYLPSLPSNTANFYLGDNVQTQTIDLSNKAVGRFKDALGASAQLGASLAEVEETFAMVATRLGSLRRGYSALRKGRFKSFCKAVNVRPLPRHSNLKRSKSKDAGALWLEYWFGWAPTLSDIYSGIEVVCSEFAPERIRVTASQVVRRPWSSAYRGGTITEFFDGKESVAIQADVTVSNPNIWLLNRLGLLNPAEIAWELVPFSFMVDWFGNVGDVLSDWTAYAGLTLDRAFTTTFVRGLVTIDENYSWAGVRDIYKTVYKYARVKRVLNVPSVRLSFNIPGSVSGTRAATACSLTALIFGKG